MNKNKIFLWTLSHVSIKGNKAADNEAEHAINNPSSINIQVILHTYIKLYI